MDRSLDDVTALVVNYKTLDLTRRAIGTLREHYPHLRLVVIDNGSWDDSTAFLGEVARADPYVDAVFNARNRYHGPALDQGIRLASTPYVFTLDSDCEVREGGFLEAMLGLFTREAVYAVGEIAYKNRFGYTYGYGETAQPEKRGRIPYIQPYAMLIARSTYLRLRPFIHHGAPCIKNMQHAKRLGYAVVPFPVHRYVVHHAEGTSAVHGFGRRARARQHIEHALSSAQAFVLRDPLVKVTKKDDAAARRFP